MGLILQEGFSPHLSLHVRSCRLAQLGSTDLGTRDALTTQTVGLPVCYVMVSTEHF